MSAAKGIVPAAIVAVSAFLLAYGAHDLLFAHVAFVRDLGLIDIQFALIQSRPPGIVHIVVTLLVPLASIGAAIALFLKRRAGWWAALLTSSFAGFVFLFGFLHSAYVRALLDGYVVSIPGPYLDLIVRVVLFFLCVFVLLQRSVRRACLDRAVNAWAVAASVLAGNLVFALLVYRG